MFCKSIFTIIISLGLIFYSLDPLCAQEREEEGILIKFSEGNYASEISFRDTLSGGKKVIPVGKPPLNPTKIGGEILAGGLSGVAGSFVGALIGAGAGGGGENEDLSGLFGGLIIGSAIGSSIGVYLIGEIGNEEGSYWATFAGSVTGMMIFFFLSPDPDYPSFWIGLYAFPTLGGVLGFNSTRRYESSYRHGSALINYNNHRLNLGMPALSLSYHPSGNASFIPTVELISVLF